MCLGYSARRPLSSAVGHALSHGRELRLIGAAPPHGSFRIAGARSYRDGTLVNVDLPEALRRPTRAANIILLPGGRVQGLRLPAGARFYRNGNLGAVNLAEALSRPDCAGNIVVMPGDSIVLPE
jgi:hypothetical protein